MEIIYGINAVMETIRAKRRRIFEIMVAREQYAEIASLAKGIPITPLTKKDLDNRAGVRHHQGLMAKIGPYPYVALADIAGLKTAVLLDSVEDPQNLGAVVRTAYALAGAGIVIPEDRSASITAAVVKASAGATEHACIAKVINLRQAAKELKQSGFWLVGLEAHAERFLADTPTFDKIALVLGGEDSGIRPVIQKELDCLARIPMAAGFNSLNVAQSAAIGLYALVTAR